MKSHNDTTKENSCEHCGAFGGGEHATMCPAAAPPVYEMVMRGEVSEADLNEAASKILPHLSPPSIFCDCVVGQHHRRVAEAGPRADGKIDPCPLPYHFACFGTGYRSGHPKHQEAECDFEARMLLPPRRERERPWDNGLTLEAELQRRRSEREK